MVGSIKGENGVETSITEGKVVGADSAVVDLPEGEFTIHALAALGEHGAGIIATEKSKAAIALFHQDTRISSRTTTNVGNVDRTIILG